MPSKTAAKYFPFVATLFFFIWFSNMLGYIPLPTNTHETVDIFGFALPAFALYAATATSRFRWCSRSSSGAATRLRASASTDSRPPQEAGSRRA